mmetsp:Transcript_33583/g.41257  ORF Transcript_33583/g.41257 Transcript_33583/m.41257 type:complete len:823 (+) Transcript_33583:329-2797(+)
MRGLSLALSKRILGSTTLHVYPAAVMQIPVRGVSTFGVGTEKDKSLGETLSRVHNDLQKLRQILDTHVIGHSDVKDALVLGLLSREHVYVEGPPGVAKTMLSELVSDSASLSHWFYQMHRDVRLSELIGETVIVKENKDGKGEVIRQDILRGGILDCQIAVLDDISRAPGEALNVLLRILNERTYGGTNSSNHSSETNKIPLISAIATGNPANDDAYYAEPLDPATLDRFTFQLRSHGLVNAGDWSAVESVIDLYAKPHEVGSRSHVDTLGHHNTFQTAGELVPLVILGDDTKRKLIKFLQILRDEYHLTEENSLLSDRTFLVKAVQALKANAVLNGRFVCEPLDLYILRFLTTFRVPENVHEKIEEIIEKALSSPDKLPPQVPSGAGDTSVGADKGPEQQPGSDSNSSSAKNQFSDGNTGNDDAANGQSNEKNEPRRNNGQSTDSAESGSSEMDATSSDSSSSSDTTGATSESDDINDNSASLSNQKGMSKSRKDDPKYFDANQDRDNNNRINASKARNYPSSVPTVNNLDTLLKRLDGRLERGSVSHNVNSGGIPRGWSRLRTFADLNDTDLVETSLWCNSPSPLLPRSHHRTRKISGGRVAILRDTSMSMEGLWNTWASALCSNVITLANKKRMRVGYLEFNDKINKHASRRQTFFTNEYNALMDRVTYVKCDGLTNYELPLSAALHEFRKLRPPKAAMGFRKNSDQHILFITDGQPTAGDRYVVHELKKAKEMGVAVHTVFIGYVNCPKVLDRLSQETGGLMYSAYFDTTSKRVEVIDRAFMGALETERTDIDVQKLNMMARLPSVFQRYLDEQGLIL